MDYFTTANLVAFATLTFLEIVLGIDNIIFISLLTNKLPESVRAKARTAGISLALVLRIAMLLGITWIIGLSKPLFTLMEHPVTGRDLILLLGGLFLIGKSTKEIHHKSSGESHVEENTGEKVTKSFMSIIIQIALLDIVFSFDSILTAIGMTNELPIMIAAIVVSLIVMLIFSGRIASFIEKHVSLQILALSFLILIGFVLVAESAHVEIPKGYIYVAVAFSLTVELINTNIRKKSSTKNSNKKGN